MKRNVPLFPSIPVAGSAWSACGRGTQQPELADLGGVFHQFGVHPADHMGDGPFGVVLPWERRGQRR